MAFLLGFSSQLHFVYSSVVEGLFLVIRVDSIMGSYQESDNGRREEIEGTPGSLVWVQRRNGSWWPGRVLGEDELPDSLPDSPKSGTPVKLLGRQDGSM